MSATETQQLFNFSAMVWWHVVIFPSISIMNILLRFFLLLVIVFIVLHVVLGLLVEFANLLLYYFFG